MQFKTKNPKTKSLINEINQLKKNIYTLNNIINELYDAKKMIEDYTLELSEINDEIKSLTDKKIKIIQDINKLKGKLSTNNINKYVAKKDNTYSKIQYKEEILKGFLVEDFKTLITYMNDNNTIRKKLSKQTKTTPIMDEFFHSQNILFLILELSLYSNNYKGIINLIVTHSYRNIPCAEFEPPTMTELKTNGDKTINDIFPIRMQPLINEIKKYNFNSLKYGDLVQFDKPFLLGGQTFDNQAGYGWEWEYGDCIYEGTLYGEVTNFFIIGFTYNSKYY